MREEERRCIENAKDWRGSVSEDGSWGTRRGGCSGARQQSREALVGAVPRLLEAPSLARAVQGTPPAGPRGFCQPVLPGCAGVQGMERDKLSISGLRVPLEGKVAALHLADEGIARDVMTQTLPILTPSMGGKPEGL